LIFTKKSIAGCSLVVSAANSITTCSAIRFYGITTLILITHDEIFDDGALVDVGPELVAEL